MPKKVKRGDKVSVRYRFEAPEKEPERGVIVGETIFNGEPGFIFEASEGFFKGAPTAIFPEEIQ